MTDATATTVTELTRDWSEFLRARDGGDGPGWLRALRTGAARQFLSNGLPGKKDEAWKYTPLRRLEDLRPGLGAIGADRGKEEWTPLLPQVTGFGFRVLDGRLQWLQPKAPKGVSMWALADAVSDPQPDELNPLRPMLEAMEVRGRGHAFEALNTALLNDGVIIHVSAGVDAGLCLAQWGLGSGASSRLDNFRIIIMLEAGARLCLLEQFHDTPPSGHAPEPVPRGGTGQALNLVLQAQLSADARLQHVRLQKESPASVIFTFNDILQAERSAYTYNGFEAGGGLVRHEINCRLTGQEARAEVNGAFVLDHERHVDHHVCVDHLAPGCSSEQFFRGVLGGRSRGVFNGKAVIRPGADGSSVRQSNANLLLSGQAEIDTKPELEIYADEVEASHGATVGQMDEAAVFYLRSRGLTETAARRLLTSAFCRAVTDRLPDREMAARIGDLLDESMPELDSKTEDKSH